jgi:hypothetical protein
MVFPVTFGCFKTLTSMESNYHSFEDLLIWQEGMDIYFMSGLRIIKSKIKSP